MLLSILLVDDETDKDGKVAACRHNAARVSPTIILSPPVFYAKYWIFQSQLWRFQQVWIALAAEVTNLHTVGLGVMVALCMD